MRSVLKCIMYSCEFPHIDLAYLLPVRYEKQMILLAQDLEGYTW